jgi:hypothetical protein
LTSTHHNRQSTRRQHRAQSDGKCEAQWFFPPFRTRKRVEKTTARPFCNAKSPSDVLLGLFARANGRKKARLAFFAMQKAHPTLLPTFLQEIRADVKIEVYVRCWQFIKEDLL